MESTVLLKRHLAAMFAAVLVVAGGVIWLSLDGATEVSRASRQLVHQHVPELRAIGDLQGVMNQRVRRLYLYYATADPQEGEALAALAPRFDAHLDTLTALAPAHADIAALRRVVERFEVDAQAFGQEMSLGATRDWDRLRDHLAAAQGHAEDADTILAGWREDIRARAAEGAHMALSQVARMKRLHVGFSIGVLLFSALVLVTWYKRMADQAEMRHRAYHDRLTGLPNRRLLEQDWEDDKGGVQAFMLVGLDRFQLVTGTFGHLVGDQLIVAVTAWLEGRLAACGQPCVLYYFSPGVWLIRMAADGDPDAPEHLATGLLTLSSATMDLADRRLNTSCSIGLTWYPQECDHLQGLLRNADAALRHAYHAGGQCLRSFDPEMKRCDEIRLSTESALRRALAEGELDLHFQPKVSARTGEQVGAEVLVRWWRDGEYVPPAVFIPVAEQSALIIPLGDWILAEACRRWAAWTRRGLVVPPLAVNISAQQFHRHDFPERVRDILREVAMPAGMLELEITEGVATENPDEVVEIMCRLKDIGVTLAIDDFGTGYSALSYLKRFPLDVLKVDQAFVRDMENSSHDMAIVNMVLTLARQLDLRVVAEGVETESQRRTLVTLGCDMLQGFLFSRPLAADDFTMGLADVPSRRAVRDETVAGGEAQSRVAASGRNQRSGAFV